METLNASPERRTVRVTYANRKKRRSMDKDEDVGYSDASADSKDRNLMSSTRAKNPESPKASITVQHKAHRRVDSLDLPGPAPRRRRSGSKDSISRRKLPAHDRTSSTDMSMISNPSKSPGRDKPLSKMGMGLAFARKRFDTPESDVMPPPSEAASEKSRASRTTEAERIAYFQNHPEVAEVEPHRVLCKCCGKWLKLHSTQKYALAAWKSHKLLCSPSKPKPRRSLQLGTDPDAPSAAAASCAEDNDASSVAPSVSASEASVSIAAASKSGGTARRNAEERQRVLGLDELIGEVRPHEVYCEPCKRWIKLSNKAKYSLVNWTRHSEKVHGKRSDAPSSRVQEAERKLQLVNDAQAKEFSANRVTCKACDTVVQLSEKSPYELENWLEHKITCTLSSASPVLDSAPKALIAITEPLPEIPSLLVPMELDTPTNVRPPPSTTSTDMTFVNGANAVEGSPQSIIGQKRGREEDEGEVNERECAAVRPRTESYVPPDEKPPRPWGWFWLPWETFKKGFAEGLWTSSSSSSLPP